MKTVLTLLVCCIVSVFCFGQLKDKIDWGEKFNSTGATLILKEIGRNRANGQTVITYNMFASGLPKDVGYSLWMRLVGSDPRSVADAFINKDGLVVNILADPEHGVAEDPINLKVVAGRGEPKGFGVISDDGRFRVFVEVVPYPIENSDGPCKLSATMMAADYLMVQVAATGFQPKEELRIDQQSGSEQAQAKAIAESDGTYREFIFPFVKGQASGKLRFKVAAKSCVVGVEVPWGKGGYVIQ
jgi:hypothetical protein